MAKILVVDDSAVMRGLIVEFLTRMDHHTVLWAVDGKRAQELIIDKRGQIDLVLTDFRMPNMNGGELTLWIKANYPSIKVILQSNTEINESHGADKVLLKWDSEALLSAIEELLQQPERNKNETSD